MSLTRRSLLSLGAGGVASLLVSHVAQASCAAPQLWLVGVTNFEAEIPIDGGLLFSLNSMLLGLQGTRVVQGTEGRPVAGRLPQQLSLVRGSTQIPLQRLELSPSLVRFLPTRRPTAGVWEVRGDIRTVSTRWSATPGAPIVSPSVTRLEVSTSTQARRYGGSERGQTAVMRCRSAIPADNVVLLDWGAHKGFHAASSAGFASVMPIWNSFSGHCGRIRLPDEAPPVVGQRASVRWFDRFGREGSQQANIPIVAG